MNHRLFNTDSARLRRFIMIGVVVLCIVFLLIALQRPASDPLPFDPPPDLSAINTLPQRPFQTLYTAEVNAARSGWTADELALSARRWRAIGDQHNAITYFERALSIGDDPAWGGRLNALQSLSELYLETRQWTRARDTLTAFLESDGQDANAVTWASLMLGVLLAPHSTDANIYLERAANEPAYVDIISALTDVLGDPIRVGIALVDAEMWSNAEYAFMVALEATTDPIPIATALAYGAWTRDQQGLDGRAWMDRAVTLAPDQVVVRYLQGLHLRHIGDDRGSLNALIVATALNPTDPALFAELGMAYARVNDPESAERWLNEAVRLSRSDPRFTAMLNEFRASQTAALMDYIETHFPTDPLIPPNYERNGER